MASLRHERNIIKKKTEPAIKTVISVTSFIFHTFVPSLELDYKEVPNQINTYWNIATNSSIIINVIKGHFLQNNFDWKLNSLFSHFVNEFNKEANKDVINNISSWLTRVPVHCGIAGVP